MNGSIPQLAAVLLSIGLLAGCGAERDAPPPPDPRAVPYMEALQEALRAQDFTGALALADSAARYAPQWAEVPFMRGRVYTELRQFDRARAAYEAALELDPGYPGAWFRMAHDAFRQQDYRAALRYYERERDVVRDATARGRSVGPDALPAVWTQIGRTYSKLAVFDSARYAFERAVAVDSTFAKAHADLSEYYRDRGETERALAHARRAYRLEPGTFEHRYILGAQLLQAGSAMAALPHLEAAAAERPWYYGALYNLGQALLRVGRAEEAKGYLERAEGMQALEHKIEQAEVTARRYADRPRHWVTLAGLLLEAHRQEEALQAFRVALSLDPSNLVLHNDVANLLVMLGDTEGALRRYRSILAHDETFADAWLNLGVLHANAGRLDEAARAWRKALEVAPEHPEARANLAQLARMRRP